MKISYEEKKSYVLGDGKKCFNGHLIMPKLSPQAVLETKQQK